MYAAPSPYDNEIYMFISLSFSHSARTTYEQVASSGQQKRENEVKKTVIEMLC